MNDLIVVGAGFAGLLAANFATRQGASVTLISHGRGGLSVSHGALALGAPPPLQSWPQDHPYAQAGPARMESALGLFREITEAEGLEFAGHPSQTLDLPTAAGSILHVDLAPVTMMSGDLHLANPIVVAGLDGFRDFDSSLVADGLRRRGVFAEAVELPLPGPRPGRDWYSTDLASRFERWSPLDIARLWEPHLGKGSRLGLPAVLGITHAHGIHAALEDALHTRVFEIPTLPPSLPGLRLERALRHAALAGGCRLIEGATVIGRIDGTRSGSRVLGVSAASSGGPHSFEAGAVLLATGGALHGGWRAEQSGRVHESVFDLPIGAPADREAWVGESLLGPHPYDRLGLSVNPSMQPCDSDGQPYFPNLFACGGVLGGADRRTERNRQGIDLLTAYAAVEAALA